MYAQELSATMIEDKRRSMRTSAIIHAIIILLAILPFLKPPMPPKPFQQAILVEFEKGGNSEGSKQEGAKTAEEAAASEASEENVEEVTEEEVRDIPEVKPVETTPSPSVLTSKVEPPVITQTKVRKVEVKTSPKPTNTIPQQTKIEEVPTPKKEKVVLKPSKTRKIKVIVQRPSPKKGKGKSGGKSSRPTKDSGNGSGKGKANDGGKGDSGNGSSSSGSGQDDGNGTGDKGDGDSDSGNGKGKGEGDDVGDGILTRTLIKYPDFTGIIKESGTIAVNLCADRSGRVTFVEFNREYSTITDMAVIRKAVSYAKEYLFEADPTAPPRECGRSVFRIEIEE